MENDKSALLVEDNADDAFLMRRAWQKSGLTNPLIHRWNGCEAVELLEKPDAPNVGVVILDIKMPKMNGYETLQWIKKEPRYAGLPIVMLTSSSIESDKENV